MEDRRKCENADERLRQQRLLASIQCLSWPSYQTRVLGKYSDDTVTWLDGALEITCPGPGASGTRVILLDNQVRILFKFLKKHLKEGEAPRTGRS